MGDSSRWQGDGFFHHSALGQAVRKQGAEGEAGSLYLPFLFQTFPLFPRHHSQLSLEEGRAHRRAVTDVLPSLSRRAQFPVLLPRRWGNGDVI